MNSTITIIRPDNSIVIDGIGREVDCSSLPAYVKAIQWTRVSGWIEFVQDGKGQFLPNLTIADFAPYNYLIEKWTEVGKPEPPEVDVAETKPQHTARKATK